MIERSQVEATYAPALQDEDASSGRSTARPAGHGFLAVPGPVGPLGCAEPFGPATMNCGSSRGGNDAQTIQPNKPIIIVGTGAVARRFFTDSL